jgi:formylglycine-generating enzyme required for sulfatase activity
VHFFAIVLLLSFVTTASCADQKPEAGFRDCPDCPEMVVIPPGHFQMGSADDDTQRDLRLIPPPLVRFGNGIGNIRSGDCEEVDDTRTSTT